MFKFRRRSHGPLRDARSAQRWLATLPLNDPLLVQREVMDALRAHFRPEFINRVDEIIIFHALTREQMRHIVDIQLRGLVKRLEDRKIRVDLTDRAKDLIIEEGYDPTYGARPLKRTIQRRILDPLAIKVLEGQFREGDTVSIDVTAGDLTFTKAETGIAV